MYIYKGRLVKISENIAFLFYKEIYKKYLILYYKTEILLKVALSTINQTINHKSTATFHEISYIRVITKLPNSEQSYKGKVKTHISFATLFRVVANEDLVNPGDVLAGMLSLFSLFINA
jgi:spore coat protein CotH